MDLATRFQAYADDFERSYADGDWLRLAPYFTDDAVYECVSPPELAFRVEGRAAILARFEEVTNTFDRTFASRTMRFDLPHQSGRHVTIGGVVVYAAPDAPPFELPFTEIAEFRGAEIVRLEDAAGPETAARMREWFALYGDRLAR
jgi:SnoaL-like domain